MKTLKEKKTKKAQSAIHQRVVEFALSQCKSVRDFERTCGFSPTYVAGIRKSPSASAFKKMTEAFPNLNLNWLMYGEGAMLNETLNEINSVGSIEIPVAVWDEFKKMTETINSQQKTLNLHAETILSQADSLNRVLAKSTIVGPDINTSK